MKKVEKITRPFRYDLNQIPYNYTVKVTNRFKGLDLISRVPEEQWKEVCGIVQETVIKNIPKKRIAKRQICCLRRSYIAEKRRDVKGKEERERYTQLNEEFQRIARRDRKAFLSDQRKETEENNKMGNTRDLFKKIGVTKGTFHTKIDTIKDKNSKELTEAKV